MKLDKKAKAVAAVYAITLFVYILAFIMTPFSKNAASWISFFFTIVSVIISYAVTKMAFEKKETLVSKLYGYPIFKVGIVYVFVQFIVGVIICMIGAFVSVPAWCAVVFGIVWLGMNMIGVIAVEQSRDIVENIDAAAETKRETMTMFQIKVSGLLNSCEDAELRKELKTLEEAFHFSDPVSNDYTIVSENKITELLHELTAQINEGNVTASLENIKTISQILVERNRICQLKK